MRKGAFMNTKLLSPVLVALLGLGAAGCNEDTWYEDWYDTTPVLEEADTSYSTAAHWAPQDAEFTLAFLCVDRTQDSVDYFAQMLELSAVTYIDYFLYYEYGVPFRDWQAALDGVEENPPTELIGPTHLWVVAGDISFPGVIGGYYPRFYLDGVESAMWNVETGGGYYDSGNFYDYVYGDYYLAGTTCDPLVEGYAAPAAQAHFDVVVSDFVTPSVTHLFSYEGGEADSAY